MAKKKDDGYLSRLAEQAEEGICLTDLSGNILYMNRSAQVMADETDFAGKKEWELFGVPSSVDKCFEREVVSYTKKRDDGRGFSVISQIISAEGEECILSVLREKTPEKEEDDIDALLVYKGSSMSHMLSLAAKLAKIDSTVLIVGESGTGKVMLAQYIHRNSCRKDEPFVSFDCAAMPAELLEEEFFGRVGVNGNLEKPGILAGAAGGTLFLDEIDALPIFIQTRILYALQEKIYNPVGGRKNMAVECRLVAATNRDLSQLVASGDFREDLFYLIDVFEVKVPPIRERVMDIMPLIRYLAERYNKRYGLHRQITEGALDVLVKYDWPGNLREMDNTIERMIVMAPEDIIDVYHLPDNIRFQVVADDNVKKEQSSLDEAVEEVESAIIRRTYEKYKSSYEVARVLKISQSKASRLIRKYCK